MGQGKLYCVYYPQHFMFSGVAYHTFIWIFREVLTFRKVEVTENRQKEATWSSRLKILLGLIIHFCLKEKITNTREVWQHGGLDFLEAHNLSDDHAMMEDCFVRFLVPQDTWMISSPPLPAHPVHCWTLHTVPTLFHDERCPLWVLQLKWTVVRQHQNVGIQSWWEKSYLFS